MDEMKQKPDYRTNQMVFYVLIILTIGEFYLGYIATTSIAAIMIFIGLLKAGYIVVHYMNMGRLFASDEEGH